MRSRLDSFEWTAYCKIEGSLIRRAFWGVPLLNQRLVPNRALRIREFCFKLLVDFWRESWKQSIQMVRIVGSTLGLFVSPRIWLNIWEAFPFRSKFSKLLFQKETILSHLASNVRLIYNFINFSQVLDKKLIIWDALFATRKAQIRNVRSVEYAGLFVMKNVVLFFLSNWIIRRFVLTASLSKTRNN